MTIIYAHAFFALAAVPVGLYIFFTKKGTKQHRFIGRVWVFCLLIVSLTGLFITSPMTDTVFNPGWYSWIHLLIPFTIGNLIYSIYSIRLFKKTRLEKHKNAHIYSMIGVYFGALMVAGAFTLMPGRMFHEILFG
ncbi:MAG: DUF2306 domain-containing protein [Kordiimonadaceae bacterium]|jgi:uncharacterized membrane protein|nr:DUF2306 domain-containing protein [Kordiimonadaceae bacterium]